MVAPGANGSFPSSTDDATKPKNIIALSNPHTRTTGFQGTRMYMADLRGRKAAYDYVYYTAKTAKLFRENLGWCPNSLRHFAYTDLNSVWYNSITEQGQMFWIAAVRGAVWKPV